MSDYILYIDDSGMKEYYKDKTVYTGKPNTRYFVFGSFLINEVNIPKLVDKIRDKKLEYFGTTKVEIKSNWIRIPKERENHYLSKYQINEERLDSFVKNIYQIICDSDIQLIGAVVDKLQEEEQYPKPWYTSAIAYEILLQRVVQEVVLPNKVRVVVDDITGATPKGNQYKRNLSSQHEQLMKSGSRLLPKLSYASLHGRLRFINSSSSDQIQIADIVAYNIYRQFVDHGEDWESEVAKKILPTYSYFNQICGKFRRGPNNRVQGYGVVKFPVINKIRWSIVKKKTAP
jgi:hypothetical protein